MSFCVSQTFSSSTRLRSKDEKFSRAVSHDKPPITHDFAIKI